MSTVYLAYIRGDVFSENVILEKEPVRLGTGVGCDVRVREGEFPEAFEITLQSEGESGCALVWSDNLYMISEEGLLSFDGHLRHGEEVSFRFQQTGQLLFRILLRIRFRRENGNYRLHLLIGETDCITVGPRGSLIRLGSPCAYGEHVFLHRRGGSWKWR